MQANITPNEKFSIFENFDPLFDNENGIENANMLKKRIEYYKRYISATEPIAFECYKKYSRRWGFYKVEDQDNSSQETADLSQETTEKNSEISSLSQEAEKGNETAEISSAKEDTTEDCTSLGLNIVFYTDEGQIFELTPFVDISSIVLEEKIVDPSLKTAASQFSFSVSGLSEEFLNFLFFRNEDHLHKSK